GPLVLCGTGKEPPGEAQATLAGSAQGLVGPLQCLSNDRRCTPEGDGVAPAADYEASGQSSDWTICPVREPRAPLQTRHQDVPTRRDLRGFRQPKASRK